MNNYIAASLFILFFIPLAHARLTDSQEIITFKDNNLTIQVKPNFHLNQDAPAKLILIPSNEIIYPKIKTRTEFTFHAAQKFTNELILEYFICDDDNTTCEKHQENYTIQNNQLVIQPPTLSTESIPPKNDTFIYNHHHFISDNLSAALKKAALEKKLLFVDFSAPWCPACLRLETEVFGESLFIKSSKNFITVSLNMDSPETREYFSKYNVTVIPTMIIMDYEGSEVYRMVDFRKTNDLVNEINSITKSSGRKRSLKEYQRLASKGNQKAIEFVAKHFYQMYDFKEALIWFNKLKKENLFSIAAKIQADEKELIESRIKNYRQAIKKYSSSLDSIVWRNELAKLLMANNHSESLTEAKSILAKNIFIINKSIENKTLQNKIFKETAQGLFTSFENEELYALKIEAYQLMHDSSSEIEAIAVLKKLILEHSFSADRPGEILTAIDYMKTANLNAEIEFWYKELIAKYPTFDLYPRKLAKFYYNEKKYQQALPHALKAVDLSTKYLFTSYITLAKIQKELNLKSEASQTASKALLLPDAKWPSNKETIDTLKSMAL